MRQGQKNNRSRGRNNRKGPNPLTRSYESNGPDVKVRGTAQHVADKYSTLARDALASGDSVAAENYFQHAEHYNRIIATATAQQNAAREEREEERRQAAEAQAAAAAAQQEEQPDLSANGSARASNDDQPVVQMPEPQETAIIKEPTNVGDEQPNVDGPVKAKAENGDEASGEDAPKPRRRAPRKPRAKAPPKAKAADKAPVEGAGDTMPADAVPSFLMNE